MMMTCQQFGHCPFVMAFSKLQRYEIITLSDVSVMKMCSLIHVSAALMHSCVCVYVGRGEGGVVTSFFLHPNHVPTIQSFQDHCNAS